MKIYVKNKNSLSLLLLKLGYSQRSFGRKIKISGGYMNQIIKGVRNPSAKVAKNICEGLETSFDEIFFVGNDYKSNAT
ncbi:helix-turn-helix transcriptional regulator [Alkaliphilus metalliredigens]|uniref:helix-turn-helix transcriptional regulator n=1 Tax=Alkaliphilus metalliredigens TaxID=208226 RepID=UPI0005A24453|nr:helix-turn-helix transcriptional regulator [Alkaliphilus metalliredigens]